MRKLKHQILPKPILIFSLLILVGAAYLLGWSKIFVVEKIVIASQDKDVVKEITMKIAQSPSVVKIGQPLARVDRREIASRLRELLWVDNVELDRKIFTGEVLIKVVPRSPIARLVSTNSNNVESVGFMSKDLDFFYLPRQAVQQAIATGETNWGDIPELNFSGEIASSTNAEREDIRELIRTLSTQGYGIRGITVKSPTEFSSSIMRDTRKLDIYWGSVKELPLKIEVMERLLDLKENKRVKSINLSNPVAPIVK
jgi:hypothetical protein